MVSRTTAVSVATSNPWVQNERHRFLFASIQWRLYCTFFESALTEVDDLLTMLFKRIDMSTNMNAANRNELKF